MEMNNIVLTQWQKDRFEEIYNVIPLLSVEDFMKCVTRLLSIDVAHQYVPTKGEAVLVKKLENDVWVADVATGYMWQTYGGRSYNYDFCIPFNASLVGRNSI